MRQIEIRQPGGPEVLHLVEAARPRPGAGQVLLKVTAAGVNRLDCLQRAGHYPPPPGASPIPGLEVAGHVLELGPGVTHLQAGDAVCALLSGGGYAEYAVADAALCLPLPQGMDMAHAAALPEAAFTVWSMVWQRCALQAGETLLVQGGSSGVGSFAVQLARARGHTVLATAGGPEKCAAVRRLGANHVIDYRAQDFAAAVLDLTGGRGVDVILDMVGGPYLARHLDILADDGRLAIIAFLGGARGECNTSQLLRKRLTVTASTLRNREPAFKHAIASQLRLQVWPLLDAGLLSPLLHESRPLAEASAAHAALEGGWVSGKLVLLP